jgi:hypothetical protein
MDRDKLLSELRDLLVSCLREIDANRPLAMPTASPFFVVEVLEPEAYVQALASDVGGWFWIEASSARSAPKLKRILTKARRNTLASLKFRSPDRQHPNYWRRMRGVTPAQHLRAAAVMAEILVEVFGVTELDDIDIDLNVLECRDGEIGYAGLEVEVIEPWWKRYLSRLIPSRWLTIIHRE